MRRPLLGIGTFAAVLLAACTSNAGQPAAPAPPAAHAPSTIPSAPAQVAPGAAAPTSEALPAKVGALYSSQNVDSLVFYIADRYGFWTQEGLPVELGYAAANTADAALISGQTQVLAGGGSEAIAAAANGADMVMIAGIFNSTPFRLIAQPDVRTAADLKGKRIGITRPGSVTDMTARIAVEKLGLNPQTDVEFLSMGEMRVLINSLTTSAIQAGMAYPPDTAPLEDQGYNTLYDPAKEKLPFQHKAVEVMRGWAQQYPAAVDRTLRGVVRAIHFIRTNRAETIAAVGEFLGVTDQRGLEEAYDEVILPLIPAEPFASVEGTRTILDILARSNPQVRDVDPAQIIDNHWVQQLVDSGYIAQLYGR
ncbi:MAG TPA: ABC transporter substrate-binding protein [Chloroflexota bacterium]|nr:ABC transporter substrate-binding protein [Chloroflexota bacterium]